MVDKSLTIPEQAKKIEEDCERAAIRDALVSARWHKWNLFLGLSSAISAAIAAFLAGAGHEVFNSLSVAYANLWTAFFALISSVLASTLTFLAPAERANAYRQTSNKYHGLREQIRFFINTKCAAGAGGLDAELETIITAKHEIDTDHPILPEWAYEKAHVRLKAKIERNKELERLRAKTAELVAQGTDGR